MNHITKTIKKIKFENEMSWHFLLEKRTERMLLFPFWRYFEYLHKNIYYCIGKLPHLVSAQSLRELIASNMEVTVLDVVKRTLVWEFNICYRKQMDITLNEFLKSISSEDQLNILFKKYPVIKIVFIRLINNYHDFVIDLMNRLKVDLPELRAAFKLDDFYLNSYEIKGDSHCLGKRVTALTFQNANSKKNRKLIYKPRDVGLEKSFNEFIEVDPIGETTIPYYLDSVQFIGTLRHCA
jgi:lantibiotic modifying enzyme